MAIRELNRGEIKLALPPLRQGVAIERVLEEIDAAIQKFYADWGEHRTNEVKLLDDNKISYPFKPYPSKVKNGRRVSAGRAPKEEEQRYIESLLLIYEHATGHRIGRSNPSESKRANAPPSTNRPQPFLLACLRAAQICAGPEDYPRYPTALVRKAIKKLYADAQRGRPRKRT